MIFSKRTILYIYNIIIIAILIQSSGGPEFRSSASPEDWTIDGSRVYIDNPQVYLSADPHTIYGSGWVEFTLSSKQFSGDADVIWGFNTPSVRPTKAQIYKNVQKYTVPPDNTTEPEPYYEYDWVDWSPDFEKKSFDKAGMNTWYLLKELPIIATATYKVRIYITIKFIDEPITGKYVWGIKRSQDTIQDAYILDPWYNAEWTFREVGNVDSDYVGSNLNYFPVMIHHNLTNYALAQADGDDILFTDSSDNKLCHEIENYDSTTGELWAWVEMNITSASDTEFHLYYGNPSCGDQQDITGTWDNAGYEAVYHYAEASGTIYDSTSNDNDGHTTDMSYSESAIAYNALLYADATCDVDYGDVDLTGTDATVEIWLNFTSHGAWDYALSKTWKYYITSDASGDKMGAGFNDAGGFTVASSSNSISDSTWYYIVGTHEDTAADGIKVWWNGVEDGSAASNGNLIQDANSLFTGVSNEWGDQFLGVIDEVRLTDSLHSADWINATYHSIATSAFVYWDTVETVTHSFTVTTAKTVTETISSASSSTTDDITIGSFYTTYTDGTCITSCYSTTVGDTTCITGTQTTSTGIMQTVTVSVDQTIQEIQTIDQIMSETLQVNVERDGSSTILTAIVLMFATIVVLIVLRRRH